MSYAPIRPEHLISTDLQELFNHVVRALAQQGHQATTSNGGCAYRRDDGAMCSVGHALRPGEYNENMEGYPITAHARRANWGEGDLCTFLERLQFAHDFPERRDGVVWRLREIAEDYNLNDDVIDEVMGDTWQLEATWRQSLNQSISG